MLITAITIVLQSVPVTSRRFHQWTAAIK